MPLPLPATYRRDRVGTLFLDDAGGLAPVAAAYRRAHAIKPAREDDERIAVLAIDCQVAFCLPGASLFVPGAVEDAQRGIEWIYRNLARITTLFFTLDTHSVFQVFHPASWVDEEGRHPAPFTAITAQEVREGRWRPLPRGGRFEDPVAACLEYCERLEAGGRYVLTIWPYHALLGGVGHALLPSFAELAHFHALAREVDPVFLLKGRTVETENYSVFAPEVRQLQGQALGAFNTAFFDAVLGHDRVYVLGQAKSHCVLFSLRDMLRECEARDPALRGRVHVLEDAMSPVPPPPLDPLPPALDFPRIADEGLRALGAAGLRLVRTTDDIGG